MSKKNKNKKANKALRAQMQRQAAQTKIVQPALQVGQPIAASTVVQDGPTPQVAKSFLVNTDEAKIAKREVKKVLLTVSVLAVLIVAIYIVNIKTDFILRLGTQIGNILGLKG